MRSGGFGFTLVEVLISVLLLAFGALALAAGSQRLHRATRAFAERERAHALAAWAVDSLLAADDIVPGATAAGSLVVSWGGDGSLAWSRVRDGRGRVIALLGARRAPRLPTLPALAP